MCAGANAANATKANPRANASKSSALPPDAARLRAAFDFNGPNSATEGEHGAHYGAIGPPDSAK